MSLSKYMTPRDTRAEALNLTGTFRGGKLVPMGVVRFDQSEGGAVTQKVTAELDPVAGRMLTNIRLQVVSVFVPALAMDALKNPEDAYPGNAEVYRQKVLSGAPVFDLEEENEISKRAGVRPRSIAGTKLVNECVRLAHNAAINHLRQRKYVKATKLDANNTAITPALVSQTVLDRLNAVLDPEDRINGSVQFSIPNVKLDVNGIGRQVAHATAAAATDVEETGGGVVSYSFNVKDQGTAGKGPIIKTDENGVPQIFAEGTLATSEMSTKDFYLAEWKDRLTREMREIVDSNPTFGEEIAVRFAHGLYMDGDKDPLVVFDREVTFGSSFQPAMDGPSLGQVNTNHVAERGFTVPIPRTEFGGVMITFAAVKPDETLEEQPHPTLTKPWGARNFVADELALDPVPVTVRDLYADCDVGDEETIVCYVGNNHLERRYTNYGFNRQLDPNTVENKTALWQIAIPMSVTPDSVIYPEDLDHYPFADQEAEVVTYNFQSMARIGTPIIFGPTPVEELAAIEDADVFEDAPEEE